MNIDPRVLRVAVTVAMVVMSTAPGLAQAPTPNADQGVAARQSANPSANPQAAALLEFQERLRAYLNLRSELARKLQPLSTAEDVADLAVRQAVLAAALRDARKGAKPGDLIPTLVAAQIRKAVADDFRTRNAEAKRAVFDGVPASGRPVVNRIVGDTSTVAPVPPLILANWPVLPDNLQYRFMGRHVILMDGDTRLIVDYIPDVLPLR